MIEIYVLQSRYHFDYMSFGEWLPSNIVSTCQIPGCTSRISVLIHRFNMSSSRLYLWNICLHSYFYSSLRLQSNNQFSLTQISIPHFTCSLHTLTNNSSLHSQPYDTLQFSLQPCHSDYSILSINQSIFTHSYFYSSLRSQSSLTQILLLASLAAILHVSFQFTTISFS